MKTIEIKEQLNPDDFLESAFPQIVKPLYKKRLFIINMAFGILFIMATVYLFSQSLKNHIKFEGMHYFYLFFAVLFPALAFYLVYREKKYYQGIVDKINALKTVYIFNDDQLKVVNEEVQLAYPLDELKQVINSPKWLIFEFGAEERIVIYKPNISSGDFELLKSKFNF